jgi:hypothetical protein
VSRRRAPVALTAAAAAATLALAACGSDARPGGGSAAATPAPPPALPASALPELEATQRTLTTALLARETPSPGLRDRLQGWGYVTGFARTFRGESHSLQNVESRSLRFATPRGAQAFVNAVRTHPGQFYPGGISARDFASRGRHGVVVRAASCSCHLANPALLGVVTRGPLVTWLEINGPRATVRALHRLADRAP